MAIAAWGGNHFTPLLQLYRRDEGFTALQVDELLATYIVGLIPAFLLSGPLSDRYGRKPLMALGLVTGAVASVLLGVFPDHFTLLASGRLLSGISVATAMTVGTSWIKELSEPPWEPHARIGQGARRASLTLTAGLGIGAGISGTLAQWGPLPTLVPYLIQIGISIVAAAILLHTPDTSPRDATRPLLADLRIPRRARRRFATVVLPLAPWVFASAALAYAVTPSIIGTAAGPDTIAFATLLTVVTLAAGAAVQPFTAYIARISHGHNAVTGMCLIIAGTILCAITANTRSIPTAVVTAAVLGLGYGVCLVAGLVEIEDLMHPRDLGSLTGIYYSLTYVGFILPAILAATSQHSSYPLDLTIIATICTACTALVAAARHHKKA